MTRRECAVGAHRGGGKDASVKARNAAEDEEYGERTAGEKQDPREREREIERECARCVSRVRRVRA